MIKKATERKLTFLPRKHANGQWLMRKYLAPLIVRRWQISILAGSVHVSVVAVWGWLLHSAGAHPIAEYLHWGSGPAPSTSLLLIRVCDEQQLEAELHTRAKSVTSQCVPVCPSTSGLCPCALCSELPVAKKVQNVGMGEGKWLDEVGIFPKYHSHVLE